MKADCRIRISTCTSSKQDKSMAKVRYVGGRFWVLSIICIVFSGEVGCDVSCWRCYLKRALNSCCPFPFPTKYPARNPGNCKKLSFPFPKKKWYPDCIAAPSYGHKFPRKSDGNTEFLLPCIVCIAFSALLVPYEYRREQVLLPLLRRYSSPH